MTVTSREHTTTSAPRSSCACGGSGQGQVREQWSGARGAQAASGAQPHTIRLAVSSRKSVASNDLVGTAADNSNAAAAVHRRAPPAGLRCVQRDKNGARAVDARANQRQCPRANLAH